MKTIQSIFEALLFNLLPAELVLHVTAILKNIIPLVSLLLVRIFLVTTLFFQRAEYWISVKLNQLVTGEENLKGVRFAKQI